MKIKAIVAAVGGIAAALTALNTTAGPEKINYVAERLEAQLEEQTRRFLSDRTRNRVGAGGRLEVSKIFDWFKEDWSSGYQGIRSREQYFAKYAKLLTDDAAQQQLVAEGKAPLSFLDYDWTLNDVRRQSPPA